MAPEPPHLGIRGLVAKTPSALEPYTTFEAKVRAQVSTWPQQSADLATGQIMAIWTGQQAKDGRVTVSPTNLRRVMHLGALCRSRMEPAERAWVRQLIGHLLSGALAG